MSDLWTDDSETDSVWLTGEQIVWKDWFVNFIDGVSVIDSVSGSGLAQAVLCVSW